MPGSIPGDAEGSVAQVTMSRPRPRLRVIEGGKDATVVALDSRRPMVRPARPALPGVASACAAGLIAAISWCAILAFVGFELRPRLGDVGAFLMVLAIQLAATSAAIAMMRARSQMRIAHSSVRSREGISH